MVQIGTPVGNTLLETDPCRIMYDCYPPHPGTDLFICPPLHRQVVGASPTDCKASLTAASTASAIIAWMTTSCSSVNCTSGSASGVTGASASIAEATTDCTTSTSLNILDQAVLQEFALAPPSQSNHIHVELPNLCGDGEARRE